MPTLASVLDAIRSDRETFSAATRDRIGGSRINALASFLWEYAGGKCIVCANETMRDVPASASNRAEIGHLIPASFFGISGNRAGYIPGNVGNMCRACNRAAGDYVFSANDVMAELVPTEWPLLRKISANDDDHARRASLARASRGLPF
jgi:hypothetical protein